MKNSRISLSTFVPKSTDVVILDTNILINLFYSLDFETMNNKYEVLFQNLISQKSQLLISSVQISEFINKCIRIQYKLYQSSTNTNTLEFKKDYRNTDDYREKMKAILDIIKSDIIPNFTFIDDGFSDMSTENIFLYGFSYDFNDALLVEIVRANHAILVTNDSDFANYNLDFDIVTSNRFLLMQH